jgi:alkylated DNA repair dioxygenase AlkB
LPPREADVVHLALLSEVAWEEREIVLFGRRIKQPRLIAWAGDMPYRYSGQTLEPRPWGGQLGSVLDRVCGHTEVAFNHVLLNRYRDGRDSMGFHADDEPELGPDPPVASVSLGAARRFVLAPRRGREGRIELVLEHGSLLVMRGRCQAEYRHGIPKDPAVNGERVSLTFRRLLGPPGFTG